MLQVYHPLWLVYVYTKQAFSLGTKDRFRFQREIAE